MKMSTVKREQLRTKALICRDTLTEIERFSRSEKICNRLLGLQQIKNARTLFIYMHFRSEVKTLELINKCLHAGKTVTIPHTLSKDKRLLAVRITDPEIDIAPGYCGIPEPTDALRKKAVVDPDMIDAAIIPGSVFDPTGGRLGYGGGYYDRFLADEARRAVRIGIAYTVQLVEKVPVEEHDQLMDLVVTEETIYDCRRERHAQDSCIS